MALRRKADHDLLVELNVKLDEYLKRFDKFQTDNDSEITLLHKRISDSETSTNSRIGWLEKVVYIGLGVLATLQTGLMIWSHIYK